MIERRISEKSVDFGANLTQIWYVLVWIGLEHAAYEHKPSIRSARYGGERVVEGGCRPFTIPAPACHELRFAIP
jgi:hypothetical protein